MTGDLTPLRQLLPAGLTLQQLAPIGPVPVYELVSVAELSVATSYQRKLSRSSLKMIVRIAGEWSWSRMRPLVVTRAGGCFEVIDGQHTALAALLRGDIETLPAVVVEAPRADAAQDFVAINSVRTGVTPVQLLYAEAVACRPEAAEILKAAADAGVRILRVPPADGVYNAGDTWAVNELRAAHKAGGEELVRTILSIGRRANLCPLREMMIRALILLLTAEEYRGEVSAQRLADTLARADLQRLQDEADVMALDTGQPKAACLAIGIWRALRRAA